MTEYVIFARDDLTVRLAYVRAVSDDHAVAQWRHDHSAKDLEATEELRIIPVSEMTLRGMDD